MCGCLILLFLEHDHALCEITCMTFYNSWYNPRVHSREVKGYNMMHGTVCTVKNRG